MATCLGQSALGCCVRRRLGQNVRMATPNACVRTANIVDGD